MPFWDTVMDSPTDNAYGERLIPTVVDELAVKSPERICFSFPRSLNPQDGYQDLTFRTFSNAVNKTAYFIRQEIGVSAMFETVLYMGHPDVRYFIVLLALMKTGHKVLFNSHSNSVAGHADSVKRTDCGIVLYTSGFPISNILEHCRMESVCIPELSYLLDDSPCHHYPYEKSFEEAKHQPCMVIYTAGSTGYSKPVVWTHGTFSMIDTQQTVPPLDERPCLWGDMIFGSSQRAFSALPISYGAGIALGISRVCFSGSSIVLGPPGLATADVFSGVLDYAGFDSANCIPATLEEIATRPDILEKLRKLRHITYVGGVLSKAAGDAISRYVRLYALMESTEVCTVVQHATDAGDWQYICLDLDVNGIEMRPHGDFYKLVFVMDAQQAENQGYFKTLPRLEEYSTPGLFSKHPSKLHHWKHEGWTGDMAIFQG